MQLDESSYSDSERVDEKYIKKSVQPKIYKPQDIVGDPVSQESAHSGEFKQLASNEDNYYEENDEGQKKSQDLNNQHNQHLESPERESPQNNGAQEHEVVNRLEEKPLEQKEKVQIAEQDIGVWQQDHFPAQKEEQKPQIIEKEQLQEKPISSKAIRLQAYEGGLDNKIDVDSDYLQYIKMQREKNLSKMNQSAQKEQEKLQVIENPANSVKQQIVVNQQIIHQVEADGQVQKSQNQGKNDLNENQGGHQGQHQIVQDHIKEEIVAQKYYQEPQNEEQQQQHQQHQPIKRLKPEELQPLTPSENLKFIKDSIASQIKEELWEMKEQQKAMREQYEERIVEKLELLLKEQIIQKMNQYQHQNAQQQSSVKILIEKLVEEVGKINKRFESLQKKITSIANKLP